MGACSISDKIYRPRNPRATKLYQLVLNNIDEFLEVYPYFCPSCHQRRVLEFGSFLTEHILEKVAHRQIVFSLPKMIRKCFMHNRRLLPKLSHCGWETVVEVFQSTLDRSDVRPGMVMDIQTYGGLVNWNPHLHGLCTDGCFDSEGHFYPLPRISAIALEKVFAAKVLAMLVKEKVISQEMADKILSWKHTGFSVHVQTRLEAGDKAGLKALAEYIVRSPATEKKMVLSPDGDKVLYRDKLNPTLGRNFEVFDALQFLATLTSHIPAKYKKMVVYYGWYSQPARGKRKRDGKLTRDNLIFFHQVEDDNRALRYRWSQLIKKVYADPLICPACGGRMRIIAFIEQKSVIERILKHLGILDELPQRAHSPPAKPAEVPVVYEPIFNNLSTDEQMEPAAN